MGSPRRIAGAILLLMGTGLAGCASVPEPEVHNYNFPPDVYIDEPGKLFKPLGRVRTKVEWMTLSAVQDEDHLCANYYNKAAVDLLRRAKERGADAVIAMRTVTVTVDGKAQVHRTPECSDDGQTGQILAEGVAIKWRRLEIDLPPTHGQLRARNKAAPPTDFSRLPTARPSPNLNGAHVRKVKRHVAPSPTDAPAAADPDSP